MVSDPVCRPTGVCITIVVHQSRSFCCFCSPHAYPSFNLLCLSCKTALVILGMPCERGAVGISQKAPSLGNKATLSDNCIPDFPA